MHDDNGILSEELLEEAEKHGEYQGNQEEDIEEPELEDPTLSERSFNHPFEGKSDDNDIFENDLAYEQNGRLLSGDAVQQDEQLTLRQQHFQSSINTSNERLRYDKELIDFQKELMQREFDEVRAMRQEKHRLEMQILNAELKHKFAEHQKQLEILNKRMLQDL